MRFEAIRLLKLMPLQFLKGFAASSTMRARSTL
jgi:hypothetical protein